MNIMCRLLGHQRSRTYAVFEDDRWKSYCRRCGIRMERSSEGQWTAVEPKPAPRAS